MLPTDNKKMSGFTIVEMIAVIVIIAILATVGSFVYIGAKKDAADGIRKANVQQIVDATLLYDTKYPTSTQARCGGQLNANSEAIGMGWFFLENNSGSRYNKSIFSCYRDAGLLDEKFQDPSGCTATMGYSGSSTSCKASYMKYTCKVGSFDWTQTEAAAGTNAKFYSTIYAHIDGLPAGKANWPKEGVCGSTTIDFAQSYNMNYAVNTNDPNPGADGSSSTLPTN